jgi:hypothetical protein
VSRWSGSEWILLRPEDWWELFNKNQPMFDALQTARRAILENRATMERYGIKRKVV